MKERFEGEDGPRRLREALRSQAVLGGNSELVERVASAVQVRELASGDILCTQGDSDCDVHFVLLGVGLEILVGGVPIAARDPGEVIGEMAAIEPTVTRSATVRAAGPTVVAQLSEAVFNEISERYPSIVLKGVARTIAGRLRERSKFIRPRAAVPKLFIGSSVERLNVAEVLQRSLEHARVVPTLWTNSVFKIGSTPIEDLTKALNEFDFSVFVMTPDDTTLIRNQSLPATRDNVIFELGLFMGALGRERVFGLAPRAIELRRASDLLGVALLDYDPTRDLDVALSTASGRLKEVIHRKGPR